jgi:hypothetical protein
MRIAKFFWNVLVVLPILIFAIIAALPTLVENWWSEL